MTIARRPAYLPGERGFTLIELMVVVAMVAALVAVAVVAYTRHIRSGRLVAARAFLAHIVARQEAYFQQNGVYCNASGVTGASVNFDPDLSASEPEAKPWNASTIAAGWLDLAARPEGDRTYAMVFAQASRAAVDHALEGQAANVGVPAQPAAPMTPHPWHYVVAHLDLNGDSAALNGGCAGGTPPLAPDKCTVLWASSARSEIVVRNEGN